MFLGLANVSHMSIFNDFDDTDDEYCGGIIDQFTMITVDFAPADNHESTLGTSTNDLGNDIRAHATLYSGQVEGACGLFGNSTDTGNIATNISGSNCDHINSVEDELLSNCDYTSSVEDELLSKCDTKESVEDETNSNCDTKGRLRMKLILIMTLVWLMMNLSEWVVRTQIIWMLIAMILHVNHWVLRMNFVTYMQFGTLYLNIW